MSKIRKMFTGGNTSRGFFSLHDNIISKDRNALYILKGMPGGGKSSMMKDIGNKLSDKGIDLEYHHCPSDPTSIDALVIPDLGMAMVDGTPPHIMDPVYPGLGDKIIDLAKLIDKEKLKSQKEDIIKAKESNKNAYRKAFNYFGAAGNIYKEIKFANSLLVDIEGVNREILNLAKDVFSKKSIEIKTNGFRQRHLFSTANTPEGFVDYTDTILRGVEDVYYISVEIGVGISRLMKFIVEKACIMNYSVEIYHDSTIPDEIESIYIKELDTIITSNDFGAKYKDKVIDLKRYIDLAKIEDDDYRIYDILIRKGIDSLGSAKKNHFILERSYKASIDYTGVDDIKHMLIGEIEKKIKA